MRNFKATAAAALIALSAMVPSIAFAQSSPGWTRGYVPTAAEWNAAFAAKQNVLGFTPMSTAGGVFSGRVVTAAPGATTAGFNLAPGTTPGSPVNGDLWITSTGFFARVNGVTLGPLLSNLAVGSTAITGGTTTRVLNDTAGVLGEYAVSGTGSICMTTSCAMTTPNLGTPSALVLNASNVSGTANISINGTIGATTPNTVAATSIGFSTTLTGTSTDANAIAVGRQGATNPALGVDASTALSVTGLKIKSAAAAGGLALSVTTSGTNENLTINAAGAGTITLGSISTGNIVISRALNYGGVTLSNSVVGTGPMVLGASPTFTGTITAATANFSAAVTIGIASPLAFAVGPNAGTNPTLSVITSPGAGSGATGLSLTTALAGSGFAMAVTSSGSNENVTFDAKGSGTISIGSVSTGNVIIPRALTLSVGTASTSSSTGSAVVTGGVGVSGAIWAGTYLNATPTVFASLPSCAAGIRGARAFITDGTSNTYYAPVGGGAGNIVAVFCDGSSWRVG